jgi:hypothetical protein
MDNAGLKILAKAEQTEALEVDAREGMVRDYLDTLLPADWSQMDLYQRRKFLRNDELLSKDGTVQRVRVCPQEIWAECFGEDPAKQKYMDTRAITLMLLRIEGWVKYDKAMKIPPYGVCRGYIKIK